MSRGPSPVSRAFYAFLACLALWLPARAASASVAPVDVVVMVAHAARAADAAVASIITKRESRALPARSHTARAVVTTSLGIAPRETVNHDVVERRYLRHCALLC